MCIHLHSFDSIPSTSTNQLHRIVHVGYMLPWFFFYEYLSQHPASFHSTIIEVDFIVFVCKNQHQKKTYSKKYWKKNVEYLSVVGFRKLGTLQIYLNIYLKMYKFYTACNFTSISNDIIGFFFITTRPLTKHFWPCGHLRRPSASVKKLFSNCCSTKIITT